MERNVQQKKLERGKQTIGREGKVEKRTFHSRLPRERENMRERENIRERALNSALDYHLQAKLAAVSDAFVLSNCCDNYN